MIFFKRFFDFILFGNIYVALGAVCLIQSSLIQLQTSNFLLPYSFLTFFATLFIYNLQRIFYSRQKENSIGSIRRKWIFENQFSIKLLCIIGFIGVVITFFFVDYKIIFYLSPLLILSIAYFLPSIKLRKNAWFKLLTLSLVWTMATAVVPMILSDVPLSCFPAQLHIFVRFTFMIAICIPFDIRDFDIDKEDNISTIPHILGETATRWIAFAIMLFYILLIMTEHSIWMFDRATYYGLMISAIINTLLVLLSNSKRGEYFYVAMIDGTMILQGVILMVVCYW